MEQISEFIEALKTALVFGVTLSGLVMIVVQRVKDKWFPDGGVIVKYIAIGSGAVLGSLALFFLFPLQTAPFDYFGVIARIIAAFLWAWTAPFGYDFVKEASAKGTMQSMEEWRETGLFGNESDH